MEQSEEAQAQNADPDLVNYDLKVIIIHRGGPYGGHYHAYIRDDLKEGVWNLKMPDKFAEAPTEVIKSTDKDKKEQDGDDGKAAQPEPAEEEKKDELEEESPKDLSKMSKRARKRHNAKQNEKNRKKN